MTTGAVTETTEVAIRYLEALGARDLDAAVACWAPGAVDTLVGDQDLVVPEGLRSYFGEVSPPSRTSRSRSARR